MKRPLLLIAITISLKTISWSKELTLPNIPMTDQLKWAQSAETDQERAERLKVFWNVYLPKEDGGSSDMMNSYLDGSHVCAVVHCAWELTRAYISSGEKEQALAMLNWLAQHESKTGLAPVKDAGKSDDSGDN